MTDWIGGVGHVKGDPQISGLDGSGGGGALHCDGERGGGAVLGSRTTIPASTVM